MTSTGLVAPKSSRGRSAGRRNVHDKSYVMGVIKTKMGELVNEINTLSKESDIMSKEEARFGVYHRKAESLAKDLGSMTHELAIYNEYNDRLRIGDTVDEMKEDIQALKAENEEVSTVLESSYEDKKRKEEMIKSHEQEIERVQNNWENMRRQFTPEQKEKYDALEKINQSLSVKCEQMEGQIQAMSEKKSQIENSNREGGDSFLKKEILQALGRLRDLEKQRDDLISEATNSDERGRLLAQVKRDNKEISALETRINESIQQINKAQVELEGYEDSDSTEKYKELKMKENSMDEFLNVFDAKKSEELKKMMDNAALIDETLDRMTRIVTHIENLKGSPEGNSKDLPGRSGLDALLDEKRKLELDYNKIEQLEDKINSEIDSLKNKIKTLETDIQVYSDIPKLRKEISEKAEDLKERREKLAEKAEELTLSNGEVGGQYEAKKEAVESNDIYRKIKGLETKLSELLAANEKLESSVTSNDNAYLKKVVIEDVKKFNQKLQGY